MNVQKGDFLGFTFDGVHSSELGIFRTSDGSRYTENLLPTIQDKTVQVPGADGTYYFGSYYTQKPISFPVAFDSLSDEGLRRLKVLFGDKKIHDLIFDEVPYKVYKVKATGTPNLKYIAFDKEIEEDCFDEPVSAYQNRADLYLGKVPCRTERIYKGEGQLSFTTYNPFARSRFKYLDEYTVENIPAWGEMNYFNSLNIYNNLSAWAESSGMIYSNTKIGDFILDIPNKDGVLVYNPGDLPTHFSLDLIFKGTLSSFKIANGEDKIELENVELQEGDVGVRINGKLNLVEGLKIVDEKYVESGRVYNKHIISGNFFTIPPMTEPTVYQIDYDGDCALSMHYTYLYY